MFDALHGLSLVLALLLGPNPPAPSNTERVAEVLQRYEQAMCPLTSFEADFRRITYDAVFEVELHSNGRVYFEASGNARIELVPIPTGKNVRGARYIRKEAGYGKWIWKEGFLFSFDNAGSVEKTRGPTMSMESFIAANQKAESGGWSWWRLGLAYYPQSFLPPFVTGASVADLQKRFRISFVQQKPSGKVLSFIPLSRDDLANYSRMDVLFDDNSGFPVAIKKYDVTGNKEDLYLLDAKSLRVNQPLKPGDDPLEMQSNEFERLLREPVATPRPAETLRKASAVDGLLIIPIAVSNAWLRFFS